MTKQSLTRKWPEFLAIAALAGITVATLLAVGQPIFTDDTWIHLTLGRAYAEQGPWLASDPLLADALGPPLPAAWLTGTFLYGIERFAGFTGLRVFHVVCVAIILALAWSILRKASHSRMIACLGTMIFIALSAYRLVQLRPHLFTILACLLLFKLLFESGRPASWKQVTGSILLFALWANLHASFLLGPILLGAGLFALLASAWLAEPTRRQQALERARPMVLVLVLGSLATLLNPTGAEQHLAYLAAGSETPSLERVADEWTRFSPFALPTYRLPPSLLAWFLIWGLLITTPIWVLLGIRRSTSQRTSQQNAFSMDPAWAGIALVSLVAVLVAVRFIWLGFFPLVLVASAWRQNASEPGHGHDVKAWGAAVAALLLVVAYFKIGPWPMISGLLPTRAADYQIPYQTYKYQAGAIFMLADADLRGKLFADYYLSGFAGYWLSPNVQSFINGTLNVAPEAIAANLPIRQRRGERPDETFTELLDRHNIDLFLGTRLPRVPPTSRPWYSTTAHLENTEGWIPIYRNLMGALYLRDLPRNAENLERVKQYYERQGVSFDPEVGFDPMQVIHKNPNWAVRHGLIPQHYFAIVKAASQTDPIRRNGAVELLARYHTALGKREEAIKLDFQLSRRTRNSDPAERRLVYNLLREGRAEEVTQIIQAIREDPNASPLAIQMAATADSILEDRADPGALHQMPVFSGTEALGISLGVLGPRARPPRSDEKPDSGQGP